jgi:hypothetical protein
VISNVLPVVAITSPTNNSTYTGPIDITIDASASDSDGSITNVEFYANGLKLGENTSSPYSFDWQGVSGGNYQLRAVARDNLGGAATSSVVNVTVTGGDPPTLIAVGSVWKYLDTGTNLGTTWVTRSFNDATWFSGPAQLGYGDGDEATVVGYGPNAANKYVTTYFRRSFVVNNPANFLFLTVRLLRDDGGIVYINGTEVFRSNFGEGTVLYNTYAANAGDDGTVFQVTNGVPSSLLVAGTNVVAVEIHQATANSTDITFDLELIGNSSNTRPTVAINSPFDSATFTEPANINITASASDVDGSVTRVEFYQGVTKLGELTSAPFTFPWTSVPVGTYQLRAVATDNFDARGTSAPVTIFVTASTAPTIAEVVPPPGTVSNLTQVGVSFSEPVDGVDAGDLLVNGIPASAVSGSNAVYTFSFAQPGDGVVLDQLGGFTWNYRSRIDAQTI